MENLYKILGLHPSCSFEEIKQQYRLLARTHHPDMGGDEEKFKQIKFAYEILSDPNKRAEYDRYGYVWQQIDISEDAKNSLSNLFLIILPNFDPNSGNDFLEICRNDINFTIQQTIQEKTSHENFIAKLELLKTKIRRKNDSTEGDDLFKSFINTVLSDKQKEAIHCKRKIEIGEEMLRILDGYYYGFFKLENNDQPY